MSAGWTQVPRLHFPIPLKSFVEPAVPQLLLLFVLMQTQTDLRQQLVSSLDTL